MGKGGGIKIFGIFAFQGAKKFVFLLAKIYLMGIIWVYCGFLPSVGNGGGKKKLFHKGTLKKFLGGGEGFSFSQGGGPSFRLIFQKKGKTPIVLNFFLRASKRENEGGKKIKKPGVFVFAPLKGANFLD